MLYLFEDCALDPDRRELRRGGAAVAVEPQVFDLLLFLIRNRERVVTQDDLLDGVWEGRIVSESTLRSRMNAARVAVGDNGEEQRLIRTLPRKGFRFVGVVREEVAAPADEQAGARRGIETPGHAVVPAPTTYAEAAAPPGPASSNGPHDLIVIAPHARHGEVAGAPSSFPARESPRRLVRLLGAGLAAIAAVLGVSWFLWDQTRPQPALPEGPPFDASVVPLVSDETRRALANYVSRRDAKALAISTDGIAVADGARDIASAKQEALRQCSARAKRPCRIYAEGNTVVWSPDTLPLPAPRDLRTEPLDVPLVPEEIPTIRRETQQDLTNRYMRLPNHKALALASSGTWFARERATRAEAVRLALEGCADRWQRPCLVLSVDGLLTIQIPKSRKMAGVFLPSMDTEIPASERERIGGIYQGAEWRALARGRNAWHAVAAAVSENAAIDAALASCAQADSDCRLYAIGNFRVVDE